MPGGNKNIKPEDGKQFQKGNKAAEKWTEEKALNLANDLIKWLKEKDQEGNDLGNIFYEEFLVIEKDLHPGTISYLSKKFSSFLKLIEKATKIQEIKLQKYGVGDRLNATMTKFVMINKHGWKDKQEIESKNENNNKLTIEVKSKEDAEEINNLLEDL